MTAAACLATAAAVFVLLAMPPAASRAPAQPSLVASSGASDVLTWGAALCPGQVPGAVPTVQSVDGKVDVCVQVPDVPGGTYHLAAVDYLTQLLGRTAPTTVPNGSTGASPAVSLSVVPSSVDPGQTVTVTGTLRRAYKVRSTSVAFCWAGCPGGLRYDGVAVDWRSPTTFAARITVPDAPWAQTGPDEVVSPVTGDYELGVQCVELVHECGLGPAEGEVPVHLRATARYTCQTVPGCAVLHASPALAAPGNVVRVTGYAPLAGMNAPGQPLFGMIDGEKGGPSAFGVTFASRTAPSPGALTVELHAGNAAVRVEPAPSFASLGRLTPLGQVPAGEPWLSANPAAPSLVALCADGSVNIEGPAGAAEVPTTGATALLLSDKQLAKLGKDQFGSCSTVAVDGPAVFIGYAYSPELDAPAIDGVAVYTTDWGSTWSFVPVPTRSSLSGFGGFRYGTDGAVDALFAPAEQPAGPTVPVPAVEQYSGGAWSEAPFACPTLGPCVTWAAGTIPDCGMNPSFAQVLASTDGGRHWAVPPRYLGLVQTCWPASIVALSPTEALVVGVDVGVANYSGLYPLVITKDGGLTWQLVSLPPLPGQLPGEDQQSLLVLPDGALVAFSQETWYLLGAGAAHWCPVAPMPAHVVNAYDFSLTGSALWWSAWDGSRDVVYHVAATSLTCGG